MLPEGWGKLLTGWEGLFLLCVFLMSLAPDTEKAMAPHSSTLPGKSHGWRSLVGCSPWGCEESTTEQLHFHFSLSCIGERNGNPLQCSCLEKLRDAGAWWAAVYGVGHDWSDLATAAAPDTVHCELQRSKLDYQKLNSQSCHSPAGGVLKLAENYINLQ